jgi:hypothetical protein
VEKEKRKRYDGVEPKRSWGKPGRARYYLVATLASQSGLSTSLKGGEKKLTEKLTVDK